MINTQLLIDRISEINISLNRLEEIKKNSIKEFIGNEDLKDIASFRLIKVIESCISICQHLTAKILKKAPQTYSNCFELLSENKLIPKDLSQKLQQMARFRNMLIYVYWNIDYRQIYEILQNNLEDVRPFVTCIQADWL